MKRTSLCGRSSLTAHTLLLVLASLLVLLPGTHADLEACEAVQIVATPAEIHLTDTLPVGAVEFTLSAPVPFGSTLVVCLDLGEGRQYVSLSDCCGFFDSNNWNHTFALQVTRSNNPAPVNGASFIMQVARTQWFGCESTPATAATVQMTVQSQGSGSCHSHGDPHFISLDGRSFDYQGQGDFHLLTTLDGFFSLQTRNVPCGSAACTSAAAFVHGNDRFLFKTTPSVQFGFVGDSPSFEFQVLFVPPFSYQVRFFTGVHLHVSAIDFGVPYLSISVYIPGRFRNLVKGMCGNFDGSSGNDGAFDPAWVVQPGENMLTDTTAKPVPVQPATTPMFSYFGEVDCATQGNPRILGDKATTARSLTSVQAPSAPVHTPSSVPDGGLPQGPPPMLPQSILNTGLTWVGLDAIDVTFDPQFLNAPLEDYVPDPSHDPSWDPTEHITEEILDSCRALLQPDQRCTELGVDVEQFVLSCAYDVAANGGDMKYSVSSVAQYQRVCGDAIFVQVVRTLQDHAQASHSNCPAQCSGKGSCMADTSDPLATHYFCLCVPGFTGSDCSQPTSIGGSNGGGGGGTPGLCLSAVQPYLGYSSGGNSVTVTSVDELGDSPSVLCFFLYNGVPISAPSSAVLVSPFQVACTAPAFECPQDAPPGPVSVEVRLSNDGSFPNPSDICAAQHYFYSCDCTGMPVDRSHENNDLPFTDEECKAINYVETLFQGISGHNLRTLNNGVYRFLVKMDNRPEALYIAHRFHGVYQKLPEPDMTNPSFDEHTGYAVAGPFTNWNVGAMSFSLSFRNEWACRVFVNPFFFWCPSYHSFLPLPSPQCADLPNVAGVSWAIGCCAQLPLVNGGLGPNGADNPWDEVECAALLFAEATFQSFRGASLRTLNGGSFRLVAKVPHQANGFYVAYSAVHGGYFKAPESGILQNVQFNDFTGYALDGPYTNWRVVSSAPSPIADGSFRIGVGSSWSCFYRRDTHQFTCNL